MTVVSLFSKQDPLETLVGRVTTYLRLLDDLPLDDEASVLVDTLAESVEALRGVPAGASDALLRRQVEQRANAALLSLEVLLPPSARTRLRIV